MCSDILSEHSISYKGAYSVEICYLIFRLNVMLLAYRIYLITCALEYFLCALDQILTFKSCPTTAQLEYYIYCIYVVYLIRYVYYVKHSSYVLFLRKRYEDFTKLAIFQPCK